MTISDYDRVKNAYKMMNIIGKNGCTVLPEGLFFGFDDEMIQSVVNKILYDFDKEISKFNKLHKINQMRIRLDEIINEIYSSNGKLTVDDYVNELNNEKRIKKICNKLVDKIGIDNLKTKIEYGDWTGLGSYEKATVERFGISTINPFIQHSNSTEINLDGFGDIIVSGHAIDRLRMRNTNLFSKSDSDVLKWLKHDLKYSKRARIKQKYVVMQLLNHRFEKTTYRMNKEGMVYVFVGNTLKTVHGNEAERYSVM